MKNRTLRACLLACLGLFAVTGVSEAARPLSPQQIIAKLNAERAAIGVFAAVAENPALTQGCRLHNRWMRLNDRLQHPEIRGTRGFTQAGDEAGQSSVLARGDGWRRMNPWIDAPIHLSQIYNPRLRTTGTADSDRHSCMSTWPGMDPNEAVPGDQIWTFPADGGKAPYAQNAAESPYVPQEKVGIREGTKTGPYLYVWSVSGETQPLGYDDLGEEIWPEGGYKAALARLDSGSLVGPRGPVAVKVIDDAMVDGYVGNGNGWLLPVKPLKPRTSYRATVVLGSEDRQRSVTHTWSFRTGISELAPGGYHTAPSAKKRKRCMKMQLWPRLTCLAGDYSAKLR